MKCPGSINGTCDVRTALPRALAEQRILDEIGRRIASDTEWHRLVFDRLLISHRELQARVPAAVAAKQQELDTVDRRISRLVDAVENGQPVPDLQRRLQERRAERAEMQRELQRLKAEQRTAIGEPTEQWLTQQLDNLGAVLRESTPAANSALQALLVDAIDVEQVPIPLRKRCFLRGRFRLPVAGVCAVIGSPAAETSTADGSTEIVIDFVMPKPVETQRVRARQLYDEGVMVAEIAAELKVSRSRATALLRESFALEGREMPDGRSRRSTLDKKHLEPPRYQVVANEVMALCDEGKLLGEIAEELKLDRNTVTSAVRFWHESHGLPVPDGRSRRKTPARKSRS